MASNHSEFQHRLWEAAAQLHANSQLHASKYSIPVLGLLFLEYADSRCQTDCHSCLRRNDSIGEGIVLEEAL